ncbi:MAG TPA: tol-pal system protein YbgF [Thermoanaerobaculia bacterium]|nr:tol-pal system protein YbgF [Thermoanaerobaculia bacterium]
MRRLLLILFALLLGACASTSDVRSIEDQVADLEDEIAQMKRTSAGKADVEQASRSVAEQIQTLIRSNAEMTARMTQLQERFQATQGNVEETNYRMDRLAQQINDLRRDLEALRAALRAGAPAGTEGTVPSEEVTVQPASGTAGDPLELYAAAYRDYQRGNWDLAISGFREFLEDNAQSDLADNASYWIGESFFSQKKYREAIQQFDEVISRYPKSDKVAAALLKKGYSYLETGERAQGIVQLQYVVHEHPSTAEANLARQRLRALGVATTQ